MNNQPAQASPTNSQQNSQQPLKPPASITQGAGTNGAEQRQNQQSQPQTQNSQPTLPANQPNPSAPQSQQAGQQLPSAENTNTSESLADQNIFFLLGVTDGTTEQREEFLDELQQVIWEDFLEHDAKLLITSQEYEELQKLLDTTESNSLEQQEKAIEYLEKLIPELEEIMLEKALELKADLLRERIAGMKEYFAGQQEAEEKIKRAEELILQERWHSSAKLLNSIS